MTTRTSKSASGIRGTSSPSGTSKPAAGTAKKAKARKTRVKIEGKFAAIVKKTKSLTAAQRKRALEAAGIIDAYGKLDDKFKQD